MVAWSDVKPGSGSVTLWLMFSKYTVGSDWALTSVVPVQAVMIIMAARTRKGHLLALFIYSPWLASSSSSFPFSAEAVLHSVIMCGRSGLSLCRWCSRDGVPTRFPFCCAPGRRWVGSYYVRSVSSRGCESLAPFASAGQRFGVRRLRRMSPPFPDRPPCLVLAIATTPQRE